MHPTADHAETPSATTDTTVFLVHGTWSRRADWHAPDGPLATALTRTGIDVQQFLWDGANTLRSRLKAAERLAIDIHEAETHGRRVVVVTHSHGGNVARTASHRAGPGRADRTLLCFGAPFLLVDFNRGFISSKAWLTVQFVMGMYGIRRLTEARIVPPVWNRLAANWLRSLVVFAALDATLYLLSYRTRREPLKALAALVDPPTTHAIIKVVNVPGDEAALALGAGQPLPVPHCELP